MIGKPRSSLVTYGLRYNSRLLRKRYSTTVLDEKSEDVVSQRELRERAVAEALAREEAAAAKAKALRELTNHTRELISTLNKTPSTLINARLNELQRQLAAIPNQEKVKQLDEELEKFMNENMSLPPSEIANRPWIAKINKTTEEASLGSDEAMTHIKSTTSSSYVSQFPNLKPTPDYKPYSEQELFLRHLSFSRQSGNLGSRLANVYIPKNEVKKPHEISEITISTLLAAGCHLGHSKAMWRPSTQPFIYGEYDGIHLIDLNETYSALKRTTRVIKEISKKGGIILYVGTLKHWEQHRALEEAANRSNGYYVFKRWIPGTITNFTEVTRQIGGEQLIEVDMEGKKTDRKIAETNSDRLVKPDLVVILNPVENRNCINECIKLRIPTIGLCDTDMEPSLLTYPIPCNDDSLRVSSLMVGILSKAAEDGLNERLDVLKSYKSGESVQRRHPSSRRNAQAQRST